MNKIALFFPVVFLLLSACSHETNNSRILAERNALAEEVKQEFLHAWNGYKTYAWGHDALRPLSKTPRDWYDVSLLMTPVDAFDTMVLMGLNEEAAEAKAIILDSLRFDHDMFVQNFEITIRLLGGLISSYQLDGDERFLSLATDLADRLLPVFDSPTGMPYVHVNLKTGETRQPSNNPAEIGTLMLEFGMVSKLTGNPVYYEKAKNAMVALYSRRSKIGLMGTSINVETGEWQNTEAHISGMIDSYYEYLYKAWLLFEDRDFLDMWNEHAPALQTYLLDSAQTGTWYGRADMHTGIRTATTYGALDAFMPGLLVLAGNIETAKAVQKSNYDMWNLHGIEPEGINYADMKVTSPVYVLRPENIESAFYLYRTTGETTYLEMGKTMFKSLVEHCKTEDAYAALRSVVTKEKMDDMESFFLAETLKYAWLLFSDESVLNLDEYVFNTEAHPFKILR